MSGMITPVRPPRRDAMNAYYRAPGLATLRSGRTAI
jgi:hypothetical protein